MVSSKLLNLVILKHTTIVLSSQKPPTNVCLSPETDHKQLFKSSAFSESLLPSWPYPSGEVPTEHCREFVYSCCLLQANPRFCINCLSFTASLLYWLITLFTAFLFDLYWRWGQILKCKLTNTQVNKDTCLNICSYMLRQRLSCRACMTFEKLRRKVC